MPKSFVLKSVILLVDGLVRVLTTLLLRLSESSISSLLVLTSAEVQSFAIGSCGQHSPVRTRLPESLFLYVNIRKLQKKNE